MASPQETREHALYPTNEDLFRMHVDSFNAIIRPGTETQPGLLDRMLPDIAPLTVPGDPVLGFPQVEFSYFDVRIEHKPLVPQHYSQSSILEGDATTRNLYPQECRERRLTYNSPIHVGVRVRVSDPPTNDSDRFSRPDNAVSFDIRLQAGRVPIMVKSFACHTYGKSGGTGTHSLLNAEEANEGGGFFLINGQPRMLRMLIVDRANYPLVYQRKAFAKRQSGFTEYAAFLRGMRPDMTSTPTYLHLNSSHQLVGCVTIRLHRAGVGASGTGARTVYIPLGILLHALTDCTDKQIYAHLAAAVAKPQSGATNDTDKISGDDLFLSQAVLATLRFAQSTVQQYSQKTGVAFSTAKVYRQYVGQQIRKAPGMSYAFPSYLSDEEVFFQCMHRSFMAHLSPCSLQDNDLCSKSIADEEILHSKWLLTVQTARKLLLVASDSLPADNADYFSNQEVLLPGNMYISALKESMYSQLARLAFKYSQMRRSWTRKHLRTTPSPQPEQKSSVDVSSTATQRQNVVDTNVTRIPNLRRRQFWEKLLRKSLELGSRMDYFMSTGNVSAGGAGYMGVTQRSGFSLTPDRINYWRYLSHYTSVHRGAFFTEAKITSVRKLRPESWGFLCPVHTPDGTPCGLLNQLCFRTHVLTGLEGRPGERVQLLSDVTRMLARQGLSPLSVTSAPAPGSIPVFVNGCPIGSVKASQADSLSHLVRQWKLSVPNPPDASKVKSGGSGDRLFTEIYASTDIARDGTYPGVYIFLGGTGRAVRPVLNVTTNVDIQPLEVKSMDTTSEEKPNNQVTLEWISSLEQLQMDIAVQKGDVRPSTTHVELSSDSMLSLLAACTPFSDYNQSPRNMYQCQMAKQTMGHHSHNLRGKPDNAVYRVYAPQAPLVTTDAFRKVGISQQDAQSDVPFNMENHMGALGDYPIGMNAIVAVISYTAYDMEDAMILNKMSYERGLAHGAVYKYKRILLANANADGTDKEKTMLCNPTQPPGRVRACELHKIDGRNFSLDVDGLPSVGQRVQNGEAIMSTAMGGTDSKSASGTGLQMKVHKFKSPDQATVTDVLVHSQVEGGSSGITKGLQTKAGLEAMVRLRYNRNPVVGDKFSSRHGQKGVLSVLWPSEDMPFSEGSGMTPDIIINPHAFPSRMTIGMLIESMAGKASAVKGQPMDSTPFRKYYGATNPPPADETQEEKSTGDHAQKEISVVEYFGSQLKANGYSYMGSESMYSGVSGRKLRCDIFLGVVYYQRLRHMVSDKFQMRATGKINQLTRQPVKGRKKGGGIRFGEMERDTLLAHGTSMCVHDRLMMSSDLATVNVCGACGSFISTYHCRGFRTVRDSRVRLEPQNRSGGGRRQVHCMQCRTHLHVRRVQVPYVLVYLVNELVAMNVRLCMNVTE